MPELSCLDTLTAIRTRRSVRTFTDAPISDEIVETLLRLAMQAPSAGNAQPWEFVVIRDKALLEQAADINPYAKFAPHAQLGILVCGNLHLEKYQGYWIEDTSAATENILLAAHALGIGCVWTGIYPMEDRVQKFRALIAAPDYVIPMGLLLLGYPKTLPQPQDRFLPERIHNNTW